MAPGTCCFSCPVNTSMSAHAQPPSLTYQACMGQRACICIPSRAAVTGRCNTFQLAYAMADLCRSHSDLLPVHYQLLQSRRPDCLSLPGCCLLVVHVWSFWEGAAWQQHLVCACDISVVNCTEASPGCRISPGLSQLVHGGVLAMP